MLFRSKRRKHTVEAVIDRLAIKPGITGRLTESVESALKVGDGSLIAVLGRSADRVFSEQAACPDCGTHLNGGWVQRTREVIELPVVPVEVTEHVLVARICPVCEGRRVPKDAFQGVVLGR